MGDFIIALFSVFLGGFYIGNAVNEFKKERYFFFGVDMMVAFYFIASIATFAYKVIIVL